MDKATRESIRVIKKRVNEPIYNEKGVIVDNEVTAEKLKDIISDVRLKIDATPEEMDEILKPVNMVITRGRRAMMTKTSTSLQMLKDVFLMEKRGEGAAKATIAYYERCFKKLARFLAYRGSPDGDEFMKILQRTDGKYEIYGYAMMIAALEDDDFQFQLRDFLESNCKPDKESEASIQTIESYLRGIRVILYFAMENNWIEHRRIKVSETLPDIKDCYTDSEIDRLLYKPDDEDFTEYRNWVIINYELSTGNRVSSICDLNVGDIDFEEGFINVNRQKNKNPMRLPIIPKLMPILREYVSFYRCNADGEPLSNEPLFCNRFGERLSEEGLKKTIADYNRKRQVQKTSMHLFRHTFAKRWILNGGDIVTLQQMLGQKSLKMVTHYANLFAPDLRPKAEQHALLSTVKRHTGKTLQKRKF